MDVGVEQARAREFRQLFARHAAFASRVLRRFGVADSDLPDACQDAFLVVHRKLPEFEGRAALRTWLYRICVHVASDYRKRAHRRYETEPLEREPTVAPEQGRTVELTQRIALLRRALDRLDDDKRQVFVLYELEELSMAEVADVVGCPRKTAFARLYAARARINAALARAGCAGLIVAVSPTRLRELADAELLGVLDAAIDGAATTREVATSTASFARAASHGGAGPWAMGVLAALTAAVLTTSGATLVAEQGAMLASTPGEHETALEVRPPLARVLAPSHTAAKAPLRHDRPRAHPALRHPAEPRPAAAPTPEPTRVGDWIEAPPAATQPSPEPAPEPAVGLDEVLSATSIRPLLRLGPLDHSQRWALVPHAR